MITLTNREEVDFWKAAYLEAMRSLKDVEFAAVADAAITAYRERDV